MNCEDYKKRINGYVDEEIEADERESIERHLSVCESCRREYEELVQFKETLDMIQFKEPTNAELGRYWSNIYNRLERGLGWICFSLGAILLLCWGAFTMIEELVEDPKVSVVVKIGAIALIFGMVILFVSIARERLTALFRNMVGGEISEYTKLMGESREQAIDRMTDQAQRMGANAVVSVRLTTSMLMGGAAEIVAYGTAVVVE
ncbi:MAG: heavy metal-binding domain-containing protein [Pirellulales bacterium]|nr:heavy metal-binding domain-containing protein [Pirellulales bacterium]